MPQPDYENDLVFPPKSADDLNEQRRQSDVLIGAIKKLEQEVKQLRALLKECKDIIEWYKVDTGYIDLPTENLLTRINAVVGESEE